jgi:signal transduction histidine kinase
MPEDSQPTKAVKPSLKPFQKRKQLERDIEHITGEMYRRNKELADTNKTLSLLRTIDALVLESHASLKMVCEHIAEAITQATDYPFVGLFTRASPTSEELTLYGWSGKDLLGARQPLEFSRPVHLNLSSADWFQAPGSNCLVSLEGLSIKNMARFLHMPEADVRHSLKQIPLKSLYTLKLQVRHRLVGLLVVGFAGSTAQLTEADTLLMDRLSETIGVALDNKLLFEENQRVLRQLKESNSKLRALDEAKDDFISMASHQLRTPLTSVKGYLSMVMEGDAGKITHQQHTMISQAYSSSQRMVYIIADLLNVSRLRTGKFVIEPIPVNLAHMVGEEIKQLEEIAKNHSLKLSFQPPKNFPDLMLDETKTRQVIMNFVDNAIYYTPSGGHITVHLTNKPQTVELRVEDDGIGVPRSEQHHLFTKFYRAVNARKARPDGTGLGLFMAKKVIIAQGGALIFDSREGQGSTFGFVFSKSKLKVPADPPPKPPVAAAAPTDLIVHNDPGLSKPVVK